MADVIALLGTDYFLFPALAGVVALLLILATRLAWRSFRRPLPVLGVVIAVVTVATVQIVEGELDPAIYPALGVIFSLVAVAAALRAPLWAQAAAAIPGAVWLAIETTVTEWVWGRVMIAVLVPVAGLAIADFERRHESLGLGMSHFALAVLGVFGAIPDTEWAVALFAITTVLVFAAFPRVVASIGPVGAPVAVAVYLWVTLHGGAPRPASVVGAVGCLGLLLVEPVLAALKPSSVYLAKWARHDWVGTVVGSIPQFLVVLVCSRIAGRFTDAGPATVVVVFALAGALLVGWYLATPREGEEYGDI